MESNLNSRVGRARPFTPVVGVVPPTKPDGPPVKQVKTWIWIQSITGLALMVGLPWAMLFRRDLVLTLGLLGMAGLWGWGLLTLEKAARALGSDRGRGSANLPVLVWVAWTFAQLCLLAHDFGSNFELFLPNLAVNLILFMVIAIRAAISRRLKIPINRGTVAGVLAVTGFAAALRILPIGVLLWAWRGC
jgi:hypothetical protein